MCHLNKTGEELQMQKDRMSGLMNTHISQQCSQRIHNTRQDQLENLVAASLISNQTPLQVLEKQRQIKECHIMSMHTPIGIKEILQRTTDSQHPLLKTQHFSNTTSISSQRTTNWENIDSLYQRMAKNRSRHFRQQRNKGILAIQRVSRNIDKKQLHSFIEQIKAKFGSSRRSDSKGIIGRYSRRSTVIRSKLDKPMIRDSKSRTRKMAENYRLIHHKQVLECYLFFNGGYDNTQADNRRQELHDQDRFSDSIPPLTNRSSFSTFSKIPSQQPLFQIQGDVFRSEIRSTGIQQDFETHNEANKREAANMLN
ncbi:MAG: hypothetical protein EZS28_045651 [Streblomastix strix]|uniref:Uncharacterized protein n=1 Tax=Streblomastix strix TaxID=222440 RepID=A0A5J4TLT6_9EUKA|nr:MAG: hypothetical protein EZS28_045651 [Streblomastix strix]